MALDWRRDNGCEEDPDKNAEMCVALNSLRLMEDLGEPGLHQAKESYHPVFMMEKGIVRVKQPEEQQSV